MKRGRLSRNHKEHIQHLYDRRECGTGKEIKGANGKRMWCEVETGEDGPD